MTKSVQDSFSKVPPHDVESERCLLGSLIIDNAIFLELDSMIQSSDFYIRAHQTVYQTIHDMLSNDQTVDLVTLTEKLTVNNNIEKVGGVSTIASLPDYVPTTAHFMEYAKTIKRKSQYRRVIKLSMIAHEKAFSEEMEIGELVALIEHNAMKIIENGSFHKDIHIQPLLEETIAHVSKIQETGTLGIPTEFTDIDKLTGGLIPKDLIILAARPGMGKSALAINIMKNVARSGASSLMFSLEMGSGQVVQRILSNEADIHLHKIRGGYLSKGDWNGIIVAANDLGQDQIFIDDSPNLKLSEIRLRIKRYILKHDLKLVIIDYLQYIKGDYRGRSRENEVAEVCRGLKGFAKDFNIPVLAISQLSREVEKREDKTPKLSDLRESGGLEQDADIIIFLYRNEDIDPVKTLVRVAKHRNGKTGTIYLNFFGELQKFTNRLEVEGEQKKI